AAVRSEMIVHQSTLDDETASPTSTLRKNLTASDHYGVAADIDLDMIATTALRVTDTTFDLSSSTIEALPIATYDTDAGFGYGAKGFLLNQLGSGESFDVTLFHSTEGERWYRAMIAWPDVELRHRKIYPIAIDIELDYDRWIRNSYFGIGAGARFDDRRYYSREPLEASIAISRGFTTTIVGQFGARFTTVVNSGFIDSAKWNALPAPGLAGRRSWGSMYGSLRLDTRNSTVNPTRGVVLQSDAEVAPGIVGDVEFVTLGATAQHFWKLWYPTTVLATRVAFRGMIAPDVPTHALLSLGGNNTLRGSPQDRYLDRIMAVANAELRFPIMWRFGGVVGYDAGMVWNRLGDVDLSNWAVNPVVGLRFSMDTFVVRLDVGFGRETTGVYFNFGHIF
ncbi:MAG: BamA/TamA family outer membrane protein, partial [bacterium]|nr:BamA/TamA family outer membrane protein [Candidatus Kapabacteria bacterium]